MIHNLPPCTILIRGWRLYFARLVLSESFEEKDLSEAARAAEDELRSDFGDRSLSDDVVVRGMRRCFRSVGCDPTRYRPSFEALARRVLRGEPVPRIHPAVDICNILSLQLRVPCCVNDLGALRPPLILRAGRPGESFESLRGPFSLDKRPVLADTHGPFGTPIVDSHRAAVSPETDDVILITYLPLESPPRPSILLANLLHTTGVGKILEERRDRGPA